MKFRLRLKVCEARQRGAEFKDEVWIETERFGKQGRGVEFKDEV